MQFANRRPFKQAESYLDLTLGIDNISMFFTFRSEYNGLVSYGKTDFLTLEVTNEAYQ
jgi:hypothetical protein